MLGGTVAKFNGLYLEVGDWSAVLECRRFYSQVLGLEIDHEAEGESVWFESGGQVFGIHTGDQPAKETRWAINLVFDVDEGTTVDEEAKRLVELGVKLFMEPTDMDWGRRVVTFLDPAGHAIWYCQSLS